MNREQLTRQLIGSANKEQQMIGWYIIYQPFSNTARKLIRRANKNCKISVSIKDISKAEMETFKKFIQYGAF